MERKALDSSRGELVAVLQDAQDQGGFMQAIADASPVEKFCLEVAVGVLNDSGHQITYEEALALLQENDLDL
jgi:hypothetical protein